MLAKGRACALPGLGAREGRAFALRDWGLGRVAHSRSGIGDWGGSRIRAPGLAAGEGRAFALRDWGLGKVAHSRSALRGWGGSRIRAPGLGRVAHSRSGVGEGRASALRGWRLAKLAFTRRSRWSSCWRSGLPESSGRAGPTDGMVAISRPFLTSRRSLGSGEKQAELETDCAIRRLLHLCDHCNREGPER
jgi:hypothetical protein